MRQKLLICFDDFRPSELHSAGKNFIFLAKSPEARDAGGAEGPKLNPKDELERLKNIKSPEIKFRTGASWQEQTKAAIQTAFKQEFDKIGDAKGHLADSIIGKITQGKDFGKLQKSLNNANILPVFRGNVDSIDSIQILNGNVIYKNEDGESIAVFSMHEFFKELIQAEYQVERDEAMHRFATRRTSSKSLRKLKIYSYDSPTTSFLARMVEDEIAKEAARKAKKRKKYSTRAADDTTDAGADTDAGSAAPKKSPAAQATDAPRPVTVMPEKSKMEKESDERREAMLNAIERERNNYIVTALTYTGDGPYDVEQTNIDPMIRDEDAEVFDRRWNQLNHANELDALLREQPKTAGAKAYEGGAKGYRENPFYEQRWNRETIRDLIQGSGFWNSNETLSFRDVSDAIYSSNFEAFKKSHAWIPKPLMEWLDDNSGDLQKSLQKLTKIEREITAQKKAGKKPEEMPEEIRELAKHHYEIHQVLQILGDYFAYAQRMLNLVANLQYTDAHSASYTDYENLLEPGRAKNPEDAKVRHALYTVFMEQVTAPEEYTSEIAELAGVLGLRQEREIVFQDLNGRTASISPDWFTQRLSPAAAYKMAYEVAEVQDPKTFESKIDSGKATRFLNHLLQLGISGLRAATHDKSIKQMIERLNAVGSMAGEEPLIYTGNAKADMDNLYAAVHLRDLDDLQASEDKTTRVENEIFSQLVQIGSVMYQHTHAERKRAALDRFDESGRHLTLALSPAGVERIAKDLEATRKFRKEDIEKFKQDLTVGVGAAIDTSGSFRGGALGVNYEFPSGTSIKIAALTSDFNEYGAGLGVGQKINVSKDVTVSVNFGGAATASGVGLGGSLGATKKYEGMALTVAAGAGITPGGPGLFLGGGLDWSRTQERVEEHITKREAETHIAEVDTSPYETVKANPKRYPELYIIMHRINNIDGIDEPTKKYMFVQAYKQFKEGIRAEAADETTPVGIEKFIPQGAFFGISSSGPFIALKFELYDRKLVFRIASDVDTARDYMEKSATQKILQRLDEPGTVVAPEKIHLTGQLMRDPKSGELAYRHERTTGAIDFTQMDRFKGLREELFKEASITAEPGGLLDSESRDMGLIKLKVLEAHGNTNVYIDPKLGNDVQVVARGSSLYLSVKNNKQLFFKRQDLSYPFRERGQLEDTFLVITDNANLDLETVAFESAWYLQRTPQTSWAKRPARYRASALERERAEKAQTNIRSVDEFTAWYEENFESADRLNLTSMEEMQRAYDGLLKSMRHELPAEAKLRPDLQEIISALTSDPYFMNETYKPLTTKKYDIRGSRTDITWSENYTDLLKEINERVEHLGKPQLNPLEMDAVIFGLMTESFQNIQRGSKEQAKKLYKKYLDNFEKPMLEAFFAKHFEGQKDAEKKAAAAVKWTYDEMLKVDVSSEKFSEVKKGALFATVVGTYRVTGLRRHFNYHQVGTEWGVMGKRPLNLKAGGAEGDVAKFWIENLSPTPTVPELKNVDKAQVHAQLRSPLMLKAGQLIAAAMKPEQVEALQKLYKNPRADITEKNIGAVRDYLYTGARIREAQLKGQKTLELNKYFTLHIEPLDVSMGAFKKCGNISGLLHEEFALEYKPERKKLYFASLSEGLIDVKGHVARMPVFVPIGLALPAPIAEKPPPPPRERERIPPAEPEEPPEEIPPGREPTPTIPQEPPVVTVKIPPVKPVESEKTNPESTTGDLGGSASGGGLNNQPSGDTPIQAPPSEFEQDVAANNPPPSTESDSGTTSLGDFS
ncbi:hypothetical protein COV82_05495 [Candidatus Peregrinibacteria bacterium CG11_big_fil_rev_8_21_14_0_20_46_8]|nr:MAG: hypothetical protein COV82_05495 [Candidatus Peregrinibacteria bacterium CG11_big_fil_rev_8_21_14_0_20_46_8]